MSMFRKMVLVVAVGLLSRAPALAQLDPEPKQPCQWRVVVSVKPHPLLTPDFRERLKRDILAALQPGLGALGAVEVIDLADLPRDKWEPLWQQFDDKGFAALDAPRDLTGAKTHFLKVEHRDGKVHLESRQYDGFTGLSSPLVRAQSLRAQELAGRTAGMMLDRDFGLVGTVEPVAGKGDEAKVLVRGAGLGAVKNFVRPGDIFAVAAVRKTNRPAPPVLRTATGKIITPPPGSVPPPGLTSTPRDFTLLKVAEVGADGSCRCVVLTRYANAMPTAGGVIGYRAMKLGTVKAPVAVRLVSTEGVVYKTASAVNVRASDTAFAVGGDPKDVCTFDNSTYQFRSQQPLANVACITVALGPSQAKQFPVPILSADPITVPFDIDPAKEERAAFERSVLTAAGAAADARLAQSVCFEEVSKLIKKQKNADALARARGGFEAADATNKYLSDELAHLKEQAARVQKADNIDAILAKMEQNLAALRVYNVQLGEHLKQIAKVVARESDPNVAAKEVAAERLNVEIAVLLSRGDVDEALATYEHLLVLLPGDADVKARKDKLAAEWKAKNDAHQKARDYLLKTWPGVQTIADFRDSLPQIRAAVEECKKHGDTWTMRKLLTIFSTAVVKLNELVAQLDPASEGDKKLLGDANQVGKVMGALELEVRKLVEG
ncbi:MAG TPA: tetratricopeptide repeat protein [Gemmata sp.]